MALFNSFKFGDVDSKDYGVYISGDSVYDSPARSVDLVQVPGRNGALALDNGYYENIEVTYPAGSFGTSQEEWREKMLGIRNALAAQRGYQKLIDTYHPEHYRLGMFFAGISASPVQYNRAGQFPIRFNCKPQRFLISGDEAVEFTAEGQEEVYGPASIASFEANEGAEIRQLEVNLEPIQNLNGQSSPYPAGGGKNLIGLNTSPDAAITYNNISASDHTDDSVKLTSANAAYASMNLRYTLKAGTYTLKYQATSSDSFTPAVSVYKVSGSVLLVNSAPPNTARSFTLDEETAIRIQFFATLGTAAARTVTYSQFQLESGSSATDYAPYSNICPISGHTEVNVYRTGVNVWDEELEQGALNVNTGQPFASTSYSRSKNYIPIVASQTYYCKAGFGIYLLFYDVNKNYIGYIGSSKKNATFNPSTSTNALAGGGSLADAKYMRFRYDNSGAAYANDLSINYPSTDHDYHAYAGQTYPISLGQTVYGGTLNVVSGVLTVTHGMATFDGSSDEGWTAYASFEGYYVPLPTMRVGTRQDGISNELVGSKSSASGQKNAFWLGVNSNRLFIIGIYESMGATVADLRAYLADNPLQVTYPLATPTTVQLTATQVSTLLGQNNIWADSGEVEVKVASPVDLTNPTNFPAKPLIRVYGNGSVRVGGTIATVQNNADGYVDIDCESMNCYDTTGGRNADVSFSGNDFPELASGDNGILLTGPSKVEITPRWWEL